jgi:hypothetical protein
MIQRCTYRVTRKQGAHPHERLNSNRFVELLIPQLLSVVPTVYLDHYNSVKQNTNGQNKLNCQDLSNEISARHGELSSVVGLGPRCAHKDKN